MANNNEKKLNGTVIVTYRCNARCSMCNRYKAPSKPEEEISIETIKKLPKMYFTNITGGEPFIRTDLKDIVRELYKKSDRIVISTNGFFTDRIRYWGIELTLKGRPCMFLTFLCQKSSTKVRNGRKGKAHHNQRKQSL